MEYSVDLNKIFLRALYCSPCSGLINIAAKIPFIVLYSFNIFFPLSKNILYLYDEFAHW